MKHRRRSQRASGRSTALLVVGVAGALAFLGCKSRVLGSLSARDGASDALGLDTVAMEASSDAPNDAGVDQRPLEDGARDTGPHLPGDVDGDGCVDWADYGMLAAAYNHAVDGGLPGSAGADFNDDGWVDYLDYLTLYEHWGQGCAGDAGLPPDPRG